MKKIPNMISQSEAPAPEEIEVRKHRRDTAFYTYSLSLTAGETGSKGGTRVSITPEKRHSK